MIAGHAETQPAAAVRRSRVQSLGPLLQVVVGAELVLLFAPTVAWLLDRWTLSVWHNAHGLFVPPLVVWLSWNELRSRPELPRGSCAWGFLLVIPALLVHAVDAGLHSQLLSALSLFLMVPGLALLVLGAERTRALAFPLSLLIFAIPIPLAFTEPLQLVLRQFAADATAQLLPVFGVSVFLEGTSLYTTSGVLRITEACSGFSTLYAAMAVAWLAGYGAPNWRRRILTLSAAAPIAVAANLLRVLLLSLLVAWTDMAVLETILHPLSGMMTFALSLPLILYLGSSKGKPTAAVR